MLKCPPLPEVCREHEKPRQAETEAEGAVQTRTRSLLPICLPLSPAGARQRRPGWAGGRGSDLPAVPPSLPTSLCKGSGTNLRAAFQDHSVQKVPHLKTSPGSLPACNLLQKEQAAPEAAGQLCPPPSNPGAKPEPPHNLHACPRHSSPPLSKPVLNLLRPRWGNT